ncbi:MAG: cytochrome c oxidase assembly protein [bacterium]
MDNSQTGLVFTSWSFQPIPAIGVLVPAFLYWRGWTKVRRLAPLRYPVWRLSSFLAGLLVIYAALASPLEAFASWMLSVHMIQHLLLTMLAPPLILQGAPFLPFLSGLPRGLARSGLGPFLKEPLLKKIGRLLVHPLVAGPLFMGSNVFWHIPAFYELALGSPFWHQVEHLCFLSTAFCFWWPVVQPWPSHPAWPRWVVIPYLLVVDVQNTALSAFFTFYGRILYPTYASAPRISDLSAIDDQTLAGTLMWVPGSIAFLLPAVVIAMRYLSGSKRVRSRPLAKISVPIADRSGTFDLLAIPVVGSVMRSRYFRPLMQALLFGLAMLVVADGLFGPQVAAMNLAGVLPWTHWRGLTILALLVAGNFFCMVCPFTFFRDLGRRFLPANNPWPTALRSKWTAIVLLVVFFWAYEFFDLWQTPWWTAWIIIFYLSAAALVDGFFKGASFCKHVCPIGQFHFVSSLVSPLEVRVRDAEVCATCRTHDCLRGNDTQKGCELNLFQPSKSGNMDCTFCLDCVKACPSHNVGILAVPPGSDLLHDGKRSGVGAFSQRLDVAALVLVLTFAAFANAAGMVPLVLEFQNNHPLAGSLSFALFVVALPASLAAFSACWTVWAGGCPTSWKNVLCSMSILLAPLGVAMWAAHFLFHLCSAALTPWPVFQRLANEAGLVGAVPNWNMPPLLLNQWPAFGILLLNAGCLYTLWMLWKRSVLISTRNPVLAFLPWALLAGALYAFGVWTFMQPMEMRGTLQSMLPD